MSLQQPLTEHPRLVAALMIITIVLIAMLPFFPATTRTAQVKTQTATHTPAEAAFADAERNERPAYNTRLASQGGWKNDTDYNQLNATINVQAASPAAVIDRLSEVSPSSRVLPAGTDTIVFTVATDAPAVVRADITDKPYAELAYKLESDNGTTHTLTFPAKADTPYSFTIKAAPLDNFDQPWDVTRTVNYRVLRPYQPEYPRLFTLWWPKSSEWDQITAERLAKLSVFIANIHGFKPFDPAIVREARQLNPDLKVLTQLYSTYGCDTSFCDDLDAIDGDPKSPLYQKIYVRNADSSIWTYGAGGHPVYNFAYQSTVDYLLERNLALWQDDLLLFDGVFMDNCWRGFRYVSPGDPDAIDLDADGTADKPLVRDTAYEHGLQDFLSGLRNAMPNAAIVCNSIGGQPDQQKMHNEGKPLTDRDGDAFNYDTVVNGVEFEDELATISYSKNYWGDFTDFMNQYEAWNSATPDAMNLVPNKVVPDGAANPDNAYNDLRAMRLGLAAALMGDGLFLHGGWGWYTWFDEYDAPLGAALDDFGAPIEADSPVWQRDFTGGVALLNSSPTETITVTMDDDVYRALSGTQAPEINNGELVTEITLPPLDGRVLVRETPLAPPVPTDTTNAYLPLLQAGSAKPPDTSPSPTPPSPELPSATRDPWLWPFAQDSIWNTPIGSNATYAPANFEPNKTLGGDNVYLLKLDEANPERPVYGHASWGPGRCTGSALGFNWNIPDTFVVPDAGPGNPEGLTPNNPFAFLLPDNTTVFEAQVLARCKQDGPVYIPSWLNVGENFERAQRDLYGDGIDGQSASYGGSGHGASGMSALGGTIRVGELTGDDPIHHSLKLTMWAKKYLYYNADDETPGYRWPATGADNYAGDPNNDSRYQGSDPNVEMGTLLAIPPDATVESLGLETNAAKVLFAAMQDYGVYIVEDSAWDNALLVWEKGVKEEFNADGINPSDPDDPFFKDVNKLFQELAVVTNNAPDTIGGGGTPRAPLAPPLTR